MAKYSNLGISPMGNFKAAVDLTAAQFYAVRAGSAAGEVRVATGASNPYPLGLLGNSPSAGEAAEIMVMGPAKAVCRVATCVLAFGRDLVSASDGALEVPTSTGSAIFARYLGPTVLSGSVVEHVLVFGHPVSGLAAS